VTLPGWLQDLGFERTPDLSIFAVATVVSELAGGAFVAGIGVLLLATAAIQYVAEGRIGSREAPTAVDALLVGCLQDLAILPGVSRSGTTVSALLLRSYETPAAFRLSFVLSIPAALGAGVLVVLDAGLPAVSPTAAVVALGASAVVGYLTVDALVRVAGRAPFWAVCIGLGVLAVAGGGVFLM
jgi:undecaprenyl-diphosphatase